MTHGKKTEKVFRKLIKVLKGSASDVYIRVYQESGGHPESGTPPERTPVDTLIVPRPIVLPAADKSDVLQERIAEDVLIESGDKKVVMDASQPVVTGAILYFEDNDWHVYRLYEPALFGEVQVKVAYVRMVE